MNSHSRPPIHVVALSPVFRFSLPPERVAEAEFSFRYLERPRDIVRWAKTRAPRDGLTVVMQAELFSAKELNDLPHPVWLWFSTPLGVTPLSNIPQGSLSQRVVHERLAATRQLASSLNPQIVKGAIVADEQSRSVLADKGFEVVISSLPLNDEQIGCDFVEPTVRAVGTFSGASPHQQVYLRSLAPPPKQLAFAPDEFHQETAALSEISVGLVIHADANRCFPMEALIHLARGHTLISEPLWPRFGLEPGLDFFEVTSPSEVFHVLQYLDRSPEVTRLMAYRGKQKSQNFRASATWARLLGELPQ